jgi:hypothetical protein
MHRRGLDRFRDAIDSVAKGCDPTARSDWECSRSAAELRERHRAPHRDADESDPQRTFFEAKDRGVIGAKSCNRGRTKLSDRDCDWLQ